MECYNCGKKVGLGPRCLSCGAPLTLYRKIIHASNRRYNAALEKAKVRDLTGAAAACAESLQLYKKNTPARNLLGLIYYEQGELTKALAQWVISTSLDPENNPADRYLDSIQKNNNERERMNQALRKYNVALQNARDGGIDVAILGLRRIVAQPHPPLRAYELLALLYIKKGDRKNAARVLRKAFTLDRGNTACLRYREEVQDIRERPESRRRNTPEEPVAGEKSEVIVPQTVPRSSTRIMILGMALGAALALLAYFALIRPVQLHGINQKWSQTVISYNEKISQRDLEIEELTGTQESLETQIAALQEEVSRYAADDGLVASYDRLLQCMNAYRSQDWTALAEGFASVDLPQDASAAYREVYTFLNDFLTTGGIADSLFHTGEELFYEARYTEAIQSFEASFKADPTRSGALYYIGLCYEAQGNDERAMTYFTQLVEDFPDSDYYYNALSRMQ